MSLISVSYDINYSPKPVNVNLNMAINGNKLNVSLANVPKVVVTATPHYGVNIASDILSTVGTPVVNAISLSLGLFASNILQGKSFDVYTISDFSFNAGGGAVNLHPENLSLSNEGGMLLITGDLKIS
jgi:hypothetical protein